MHNQNVSGVRRSAREGVAVEFNEKWLFPTAATDPTGGLPLRDLDRALARISDEQRRVILLTGLEGTSYEEAATILDVPLGTIRSRVSRGRKSLRKLMDRRGGPTVSRAVPKRRCLDLEDEPTQNFSRVPM
jgi:RNA polymerase sigma-70 factor (ECF subfamily)